VKIDVHLNNGGFLCGEEKQFLQLMSFRSLQETKMLH
jgi:hypothetical protein